MMSFNAVLEDETATRKRLIDLFSNLHNFLILDNLQISFFAGHTGDSGWRFYGHRPFSVLLTADLYP